MPDPGEYINEVTSIVVLQSQYNNTSNVFIGTKGTGVWQYKYSILTSVREDKNFPHKFMLYQNYPNPFNPTTKIKYSIPVPSNLSKREALVQLKIYDILGREISTLVNKEQQPGTYEFQFDGSNLPSGVYFYRLQVGSFSDTKKLILLK